MATPIIKSIFSSGTGAPGSPSGLAASTRNQTIGSTGLNLYISGSNLTGTTAVTLGSGLTYSGSINKSSVLFIVPNVSILQSGSYSITLTNAPSEVATGSLEVYPPATISSISTSTSVAGSTNVLMTVSGSNFVTGSFVRINNGTTFIGSIASPSLMTAMVNLPAAAGIVTASIENVGNSRPWKVLTFFTASNPQPIVTSVSSTSAAGSVGTLTIRGSNFRTGATITLSSGLAQMSGSSVTVSTNAITVTNVSIGLSGTYSTVVTNPAPHLGASLPITASIVAPKALTTTTMTLTSPLIVTGGGRLVSSVIQFPGNLNMTYNVSMGNIIEIPSTVTNNYTLSLSSSGAVTGDIVTVCANPAFTKKIIVTQSGSSLFEIGNSDSDDGSWVSFIFLAGSWRLYQQAQSTKMRNVEFTSNGTFTVPRGVSQVLLYGYGGGGAGGKSGFANAATHGYAYTCSGGGGGGGGALARWQWVSVVPGDVISVVVGAGGTPGTSENKRGKDTLFGNVRFRGGAGGSDGRNASDVRTNPSLVAKPGVPWEFWFHGYEQQISADIAYDYFRPMQSGGSGGISEYYNTPSTLVHAEYGCDSENYSAGAPGTNVLENSHGGCGGGGGAGPGGNGANGGGIVDGLRLQGQTGASANPNSGAGGGGGGGGTPNTIGEALLESILGGSGGSGKLIVYYVK